MAEMLRGGTTTFADMYYFGEETARLSPSLRSYLSPALFALPLTLSPSSFSSTRPHPHPPLSPAQAEEVDRIGMRALIGLTMLRFPTAWARTKAEYVGKSLELFAKYARHPRIKMCFAPHAPYTGTPRSLGGLYST